MPANPEGLLPVEQREAIYLADRFEWAAPGDQQEDAWLVRFCDRDCGDAVFTGPDAEAEAWAHWNRYAPAFNIYVFRLARFEQSLARPGMEIREAPASYTEFQQRRGRLPDLIEETIEIHSEFMKDDNYDAYGCLDRIIAKLKTARDYYDPAVLSQVPSQEGK